MSSSRLLAVCLSLGVCACSGSRNERLNPLGSGSREASVDAAEAPEPDAEEPAPDEDAGEEPDAGPELDAGRVLDAEMQQDASVVDAVVADATEDASVVSDSAQPDAASAVVRLRVTRLGQPQANLYTVLHGAGGAVLDVADTDEDGRVETALPVQLITVVLPRIDDSVNLDLFTYTGVRAGDDLELELAGRASVDVAYELTIAEPPADVQSYEASGGPEACAQGSAYNGDTALSVQSAESCLASSDNALLVTARDGERQVLGFSLVDGLAKLAGTTLSASVGAFSAPMAAQQELRGTVGLHTDQVEVALYGLLRDQLLAVDAPNYVTVSSDTQVASVLPGFAFDLLESQARWSDARTHHLLRTRSANATAPAPLDFTHALPSLESFTMDVEQGWPRARWITAAAAERDALLFEASWSVRDQQGAAQLWGSWTAIVAPNATELTLPALPVALLQLPAGSQLDASARRLSAVRSALVNGYDGLRQERVVLFQGTASELVRLSPSAAGETEVATLSFTD